MNPPSNHASTTGFTSRHGSSEYSFEHRSSHKLPNRQGDYHPILFTQSETDVSPDRKNIVLEKIRAFVNGFRGKKKTLSNQEDEYNPIEGPDVGFTLPHGANEDLFQHRPLQKTLSILEQYHPILVTQLAADVIPARQDVEMETQRLSLLKEEIETLEEQKAEAEAGIQNLPSDIYIQENEPEFNTFQKPWWHGVLTIGLCYMLLLGLNDICGVQIRSLRPSQYPIAILNLLAASCITLGIKQIMTSLGKQNQKNEPNRNFADDPTHPNTIAWWLKIAKGDGSLWMGLFFISLETCFAAPGLISLLRPELSEQLLFQLAMVAAASLSAAANVALGWSSGSNEARHLYDQKKDEQKFKTKLEELRQNDEEQQIRGRNAQLETQGAVAKARLSQLLRDLERQEAIVFDRRIRARVENQRWEREVKRWFQDNPDKVVEYNRNQQSQNQHFDKAPSVHE
jgi:hypothetical protein